MSEALDGVIRVALIAQGHRPQVRAQVAPVRAAAASIAFVGSLVAEPEPAASAPGMTLAVERPATVPPLGAAVAALAEPAVVATAAVDTAAPLVPTPTPALAFGAERPVNPGDLTAALVEPAVSEAPLLDLIDRLPPPPAEPVQALSRNDAPAMAVNLKACTMDELWLGDFELEDPRRASLVEKIANAVKDLFRSMTLRLGFGRHSMIAYRGGRSPLSA